MKLYSRSQLIKFSAIAMVFAAVAASFITSASLKKKGNSKAESTAQNVKNENPDSKSKDEFTLLQSENTAEKNGKNGKDATKKSKKFMFSFCIETGFSSKHVYIF